MSSPAGSRGEGRALSGAVPPGVTGVSSDTYSPSPYNMTLHGAHGAVFPRQNSDNRLTREMARLLFSRRRQTEGLRPGVHSGEAAEQRCCLGPWAPGLCPAAGLGLSAHICAQEEQEGADFRNVPLTSLRDWPQNRVCRGCFVS